MRSKVSRPSIAASSSSTIASDPWLDRGDRRRRERPVDESSQAGVVGRVHREEEVVHHRPDRRDVERPVPLRRSAFRVPPAEARIAQRGRDVLVARQDPHVELGAPMDRIVLAQVAEHRDLVGGRVEQARHGPIVAAGVGRCRPVSARGGGRATAGRRRARSRVPGQAASTAPPSSGRDPRSHPGSSPQPAGRTGP